MAPKRSAALGFIFITILIDVIGFGIIIPVTPTLIQQLLHIDITHASQYGSILTFSYAFMQFICAPTLGSLSDRFGRRTIILFSLFGFGIDYLIMAMAPAYSWLVVGRIISGITGASITTAMAYIADISNADNRAKNFGMVGAAFGLGFIIGPVIGGLLGKLGPRVPFYAASALALLNWAYGYFVLPESLQPENRRAFDWKRANPLGAFQRFKKFPSLAALFISLGLVYVASHAVQSNWNYFTMYRFKWDEGMVGLSLGMVGLMVALVQGLLIRKINPLLGNEKSIFLGLLMYLLGMILFGFSTQSWMIFVFIIPYCLGGISGPAFQATMSGMVPPNAQGELQGALASLMSASAIVGPLIMNNLFFYFTHDTSPVNLPGAPFFLAAVFILFSTIIAYRSLHSGKAS